MSKSKSKNKYLESENVLTKYKRLLLDPLSNGIIIMGRPVCSKC